MKIRSTENEHFFQEQLFRRLNAYQLQGLLINDKDHFSAGIEAVQYDDHETFSEPFSPDELWARYVLTEKLGVPLYLVYYWRKFYYILQVEQDGEVSAKSKRISDKMSEQDFANWWGKLKGMPQTKQLNNGAGGRADNTVFDSALRKHGLEWGGNIDGYVLTENKKDVVCIIDNISVSTARLGNKMEDEKADPSVYFHSTNPKHGPRYEGWYGAVKLASELEIPHMLLTVDKKNPRIEHVGMTFIDELSPEGVFYIENISPNMRVVNNIDEIVLTYASLIGQMHSPKLERKE